MSHPPLCLKLHCSPDRNLSGYDRGLPIHGRDGRGHEVRGSPYGHGRVTAKPRDGSAHGDVRAGARAHAHEYVRACAPCRYENVRASAHECDHAHANAYVRAFLP